MGIKLSNNAFATLAASINSSATSITLTTGQGARFPTLSAGDYFYATLIDTSNNLEIVKCTARSTDVLTVVRAQESTTARAYSTGDRIEIRITAQTFLDAVNEIGPTQVSDEANTSTGYFDLPHGTTAQRPASPSVGYTRYNTTDNVVEAYHGATKGWIALSNIFQATGGTETVSGGYKYHTFTTSGSFIVQSGTATVDVLLVAGGGGGGATRAGGGGAGGAVDSTLAATPGTYTVSIGGGGAGGIYSPATAPTSGASTSLTGVTTAVGGGYGASRQGGVSGASGGSGGGGGCDSAAAGSGTAGQGNSGGAGTGGAGNTGGGGGGAGAAGQAFVSTSQAGAGGVGINWKSLGTFYAGGGGGGGGAGSSAGVGGNGGGGNGNAGGAGNPGFPGTANRGGGGGGAADDSSGGNGGSGIVIIRYPI